MRRAASERDANPADQTSKSIETAFSCQTLRHDGDSESGNEVFRIKAPNISFFFFPGEIKQANKGREKTNYIKATLYLAQRINLVMMFATVQCASFWPRRKGAERSEGWAGCAEAALLVRKKCTRVR